MAASIVQAETLENFLQAEEEGLSKLLKNEEFWVRNHLQGYARRPDEFKLNSEHRAKPLRTRFLESIRVNPTIKTPLDFQALPNESTSGKALTDWKDITTLKKSYKGRRKIEMGGDL